MPGDYGKTRPAVMVQNDLVGECHASVVVCPFSSHLIDAPLFRITVLPQPHNGLAVPSQIMVDKVSAVKRERIRGVVGQLDVEMMVRVNRSLALWLGL